MGCGGPTTCSLITLTLVFFFFFFWGGGGGGGGGSPDPPHSLCLFCCFTSQVNSYGHGGTVSSPNHTFFLGKFD